MGFDVTFHPIAESEIKHFIFDVIGNASLAESRANELTKKDHHRNHLMKLYQLFPRWKIDPDLPVNSTFAFAAAICAGYLHPFWYARDAGITLLAESKVPELKELFTQLTALESSTLIGRYRSNFPLFNGNESASGFIHAHEIHALRKTIDSLKSKPGRASLNFLETIMDDEAIAALEGATTFCLDHNLGLIEACDVVVPIAGRSLTRSDHLRAAFLNNL